MRKRVDVVKKHQEGYSRLSWGQDKKKKCICNWMSNKRGREGKGRPHSAYLLDTLRTSRFEKSRNRVFRAKKVQ